jgi:mRNA-degrading endonuclease RelE of RelBE toxin-antitoxin system
MKLEWTFTAESYLDQLPQEERSKVLHAVESLPTAWDSLGGARLNRLAGDDNDLYSLRVGADLRVIVLRENDVITIIDVIRRSQVDGLRRLTKARQAASG